MTAAVRAWVLESGNYVDIQFDGIIDVSAGIDTNDIYIAKDAAGTTSTQVTGAALVSTGDSKVVRFTITNQATFEGWLAAEKADSTLKLVAGAFTDIDGNPTDALAHSADVRVHFIDETSSTTTRTYHTAGEAIYLPANATVVMNDVLDQPLSTGEIRYIGYNASTVLSGDCTVGDASLACTAADPLILKIERCTFVGNIVFNTANKQYLGGWMKNVIWNGNFKHDTNYYFAGLAIDDDAKTFYLDRCNWTQEFVHSATSAETPWSVINSNISPGSSSAVYAFSDVTATGNLDVRLSYCNFANFNYALSAFGAAIVITTYNCSFSGCVAGPITNGINANDTTNASGLTGISLANSQGYGYTAGGALNAGRAFTQTATGTDDPGERSTGVPKGLMVGVGAFAATPAKVITPTAASVASDTITYTLPASSFAAGDTVRVILNNVEDTAGNVIAQDTVLSATAS